MTTTLNFIKKHSLPMYFILTFVISWGAILLLVGVDGIPVDPDQAVTLGMAILLGPSITGILLTGLISGKAGFRELGSRLIKWRVDLRWYAVAFLAAPLSTAATILVLSLFSPEYTPNILTQDDKAFILVMGIVAGLIVGFFEELGWTGFAIPRMRLYRSLFATGLIVGLLWGAWHFLLFWEKDSFTGALPLGLLFARLFSWLPAYRILMAWVHDNTESLVVVILMHASLVATLMIIDPVLSGGNLVTFILMRGAVFWIIAAMVSMARRQGFEPVTKGQA